MKFLMTILLVLFAFNASAMEEKTLIIPTKTIQDILETKDFDKSVVEQQLDGLSQDDLNRPINESGDTVLHALMKSHKKTELIRLVIKKGADVLHKNLNGDIPLHALLKHLSVKKSTTWKQKCLLLLKKDFLKQVAIKDANGSTIFDIIAQYKDQKLKTKVYGYLFDHFSKYLKKIDYFPTAAQFIEAVKTQDKEKLFRLTVFFTRLVRTANLDARVKKIVSTFNVLLSHLDEPTLVQTIHLLCSSKNYWMLTHLLEATLQKNENLGAYFIGALTSLELTELLAFAIEDRCKLSFHFLVSRGCSVTEAFSYEVKIEKHDDRSFMIEVFNQAQDLNFEFEYVPEWYEKALEKDIKENKIAPGWRMQVFTPLLWALYFSDNQTVESFVLRGAQIDYMTDVDARPLHCAIARNNTHMVKLLLDQGIDVTKSGTCHRYSAFNADALSTALVTTCYFPLHFAILLRRYDIIQLLLKYNPHGLNSNFDYYEPQLRRLVTCVPLDFTVMSNDIRLRKLLDSRAIHSPANIQRILLCPDASVETQTYKDITNLFSNTDIESLSTKWLFAALLLNCSNRVLNALFASGARVFYPIRRNNGTSLSIVEWLVANNRRDVLGLAQRTDFNLKSPYMRSLTFGAGLRKKLLFSDIDYLGLLPSATSDENHYLLLALKSATENQNFELIAFLIKDIQWLLKPIKNYSTYIHYLQNPSYITDHTLNEREQAGVGYLLNILKPKIQQKIVDAITAHDVKALYPLLSLIPLNFLHTYSIPLYNSQAGAIDVREIDETILHIAARLGHLDIVKILLFACPALIAIENSDGSTAVNLLFSEAAGRDLLKALYSIEAKLMQLIKVFGIEQVGKILKKITDETVSLPIHNEPFSQVPIANIITSTQNEISAENETSTNTEHT